MGQAKFVISVVFVALFTLAIISYTTIYAVDNNARTNLGDSSSFAAANSSLYSEMELFVEDVNSSSEGFTKSSVAPASDTLKTPGVFQNLKFTIGSINSVLHFGQTPSFISGIEIL